MRYLTPLSWTLTGAALCFGVWYALDRAWVADNDRLATELLMVKLLNGREERIHVRVQDDAGPGDSHRINPERPAGRAATPGKAGRA